MVKRSIFKSTLLFCLLLLGGIGATTLTAQTVAKATYDKSSQVLSLDENASFSYLYELDIKPMGFSSEKAAQEFFSNWTTELVSFKVDYQNREADVMLKTRMKRDWGAKEWNEYLAELPKQ